MTKLKTAVFTALLIVSGFTSNAQTLRDLANQAQNRLQGNKKGTGDLNNADITAGLKQALEVGTKNASSQLSAPNGFFGNSLIKILLPPEASDVEKNMRRFGMGSYVDKAIASMNKAAEDASSKAVPIFVTAIKNMSIQDGLSILKGSNDAATQYLKSKTTASLTSAFSPVIKEALDKADATKYWSELFTMYNKLPTTRNKVNPDLVAYVTERGLNGLFITVAQEESKIRLDPAARVTDLLKKVFGH